MDRERIREALIASGLVAKDTAKKSEQPARLPLSERKKLARLFAGEPSLSEFIIAERNGR